MGRMGDTGWDTIYARGEQLNRYPFSEVVSFFFRNLPESDRTQQSALDVGCGSGVHTAFLAEQGLNVLGIDASVAAIDAARDKYQHANIQFEKTSFANFDPGDRKFDLVVDRCSTTHSTVPTTLEFYRRLESCLNPGARIFWQGFAWDNAGRELGVDQKNGSWTDFSGGVFKPLGRTAFFSEEDVGRVFANYRMRSLRHLSDLEVGSGLAHTSWIVEATFNGE